MIDQQFTVLIGSCARGTGDEYSDIDIVRIGHTRPLTKAKLRALPKVGAPISYIDYDAESFTSLYVAGSLFIHHVMTEGKLLTGDPGRWAKLVEDFCVTKDLRVEISEQVGLCRWLARPEVFSHATMPQLSHLFRALKNAAIFSLAQQGIYVYDKREALRRAFHFLTENDIELLVAANNVYERGVPLLPSLATNNWANSLPDLCTKVAAAAGGFSYYGNQRNS